VICAIPLRHRCEVRNLGALLTGFYLKASSFKSYAGMYSAHDALILAVVLLISL
jgi:hypothetical protein